MKKELVLACDLGGTNIRIAAINADGEILHGLRAETPKTERAAEILRAIVETAEKCRAEVRKIGEIKSFAAAVPATVNFEKGSISKAPNIPALDDFPFAEALSRELNLPVLMENDANAAAIGEQTYGAARGFQNVIVVTLGTGVGGGIIVDGRILRGVDGTAGEIGHICVEPFGAPCGCGAQGCVEQYSSGTAIVRLTRELENQYPQTILRGASPLTSEGVYAAGVKGDTLALEVFRRMGFYLGIALADLVNVLNPEVIVIGGGASDGWDLFINPFREQVKTRPFRAPAERVKIVRAQLGDTAGIVGAARQAFINVAK
jgi:glucokinase